MPQDRRRSNEEDGRLIAAALDGDSVSFGKIVERYWRMAVALALRRTGDASEAEDIAQESFIKAYAGLAQLRNRGQFYGWLCRIIMQRCAEAGRRKSREKLLLAGDMSSEGCEAATASGDKAGLDVEQRQKVREVVRRLPEDYQQVVLMRFAEGLSTAEIADSLNQREGTVRVRLHRAYRMLREQLQPFLKDKEP